MITKRKWNNLSEKMSSLGINEESLIENFIKGSGKGGQKVNKTSSCVQLKYEDFEIKCQKTRSQTDNRYWARIELCERISFQRLDLFSKQKNEIHKIRKQKKRRSRRAKAKIMNDKIQRADKKRLRKKIDSMI